MKKLLLTAVSFGVAFVFSACSDDSSSSQGNPASVEENGSTGGYSAMKAINEDAEAILVDAVKGTEFETVDCDSVATQIVAGTNYKFQCSIKDGKKTKDVVLTVFESLPYTKKSPTLKSVEDADGKVLFEASNEDEEEQEEKSEVGLEDLCDGCFGDYEDLTAADSAVFKKANKISDSTFVNPKAVSKQVVAGMNYRFKCELDVSEGETKEVILEVYENLKGEVEITAVVESNADVPEEALDPKLIDIDPNSEGMMSNCDNAIVEKASNCKSK